MSINWIPGLGEPVPRSPEDWAYNCDVLAVAMHRAFGLPLIAEFETGLDEAGQTQLGYLSHAWVRLPDGRMLDANGIGDVRPAGDRAFTDPGDDWVTGLRIMQVEQNDPHLVDIRETCPDFPYDDEVATSHGIEWAIRQFGDDLRDRYGILPLVSFDADNCLESWAPKNGPDPMLPPLAAAVQERMSGLFCSEGQPSFDIQACRLTPGVDVVACRHAIPHVDAASDGFQPWFGFLVLESHGHHLAIDTQMTASSAEENSFLYRQSGAYPEAEREVPLQPGDRVVLRSSTFHWMRVDGRQADSSAGWANAPLFTAISFEFESRPTRNEMEAVIAKAMTRCRDMMEEPTQGRYLR